MTFDVFGTLIDLVDEESPETYGKFAAAAAQLGGAQLLRPADWWADQIEELRNQLRLTHPSHNEPLTDIDQSRVWNDLARLTTGGLLVGTHQLAQDLANAFRRATTRSLEPVRPGIDAVAKLRGRSELRVISNTQRCYTEHEMSRFSLQEMFDEVWFSSDVGFLKPDRRLFDQATAGRPMTWIHVGDNPLDDGVGSIRAGAAAVVMRRGRFDAVLAQMDERDMRAYQDAVGHAQILEVDERDVSNAVESLITDG